MNSNRPLGQGFFVCRNSMKLTAQLRICPAGKLQRGATARCKRRCNLSFFLIGCSSVIAFSRISSPHFVSGLLEKCLSQHFVSGLLEKCLKKSRAERLWPQRQMSLAGRSTKKSAKSGNRYFVTSLRSVRRNNDRYFFEIVVWA